MAYKLYSVETIIDEEEIETWYLDKDEGAIVTNINKLFGSTVTDCYWIDDNENKFISFMHGDWTGGEVWGILNVRGDIIIKDLKEITSYIEEGECFIVQVTGLGLAEKFESYDLPHDEWRRCVIDSSGNFIIEPLYDKISYDDVERIYFAKSRGKEEENFNFLGKKIKSY